MSTCSPSVGTGLSMSDCWPDRQPLAHEIWRDGEVSAPRDAFQVSLCIAEHSDRWAQRSSEHKLWAFSNKKSTNYDQIKVCFVFF